MFGFDDLKALASVVEHKGFAAAARHLNVTQPAISQRIQKLEDQAGKPLLIRGVPPKLTAAGERVLKHFQTLMLFDEELKRELHESEEGASRLLSVAINNDSLCTWFLESVTDFLRDNDIRLSVRLAYEPDTLNSLTQGEVSACVTSIPRARQGCESFPLGKLVYRLIATPDFAKRFFSNGITKDALRRAPTVFFGFRDPVSEEYYANQFGIPVDEIPKHFIPSSDSFRRVALLGLGYALHPAIDVAQELKAGTLIDLAPRKSHAVALYWQVPRVRPRIIEQLTKVVLKNAAMLLGRSG